VSLVPRIREPELYKRITSRALFDMLAGEEENVRMKQHLRSAQEHCDGRWESLVAFMQISVDSTDVAVQVPDTGNPHFKWKFSQSLLIHVHFHLSNYHEYSKSTI
jgi:hypothetical protein